MTLINFFKCIGIIANVVLGVCGVAISCMMFSASNTPVNVAGVFSLFITLWTTIWCSKMILFGLKKKEKKEENCSCSEHDDSCQQ